MRQSAKHHMGNLFNLSVNGLVEYGVVVSMDNTPPTRHAIYQFRTIFQNEGAAVCGAHSIKSGSLGRRAIWMPNDLPVALDQWGIRDGIVHKDSV